MTKKENRVWIIYQDPPAPLEKLTSRKDGELGFWLGLAANQAMGFSAAELISPLNKQKPQTFTRSFDEKNSIDSGFHRIFLRFTVATVSCYFNCFPESSAVVSNSDAAAATSLPPSAWQDVSAVRNLPSCDSQCGRCSVYFFLLLLLFLWQNAYEK